jgi:hypothetical protein
MYHGFARSAGLGYWQSFGYTFAGSVFWEIAGETTAPSVNDQVASGIGGSFLGEALFRMSSLVLERGSAPRFWRELGATVVSPPTGFNRLAFGERFDTVFSSRNAAYYSRFGLALSGTTKNESGTSTELQRDELLVDFALDYGLPGKPGYSYRRPFDYFAFQITASSANLVENLLVRGLLVGDDYGGGSHRGVWGLYGSYDYIAPQIYRVSSTALSLSTTGEWRMSHELSLQATALAGAGYAAVGTMQGSSDEYHYGLAPQALLALRLTFGDRASLEVTGREYFVSKVGAAADTGGHDNIIRVDAALTVRLYRQQAVAVRYLHNRRDASFPAGDITQTRATLGIYYVLLGNDRFGTFDWR